MTGDFIAYILSKLFDWKQGLNVRSIIKTGVLAGSSSTKIISNLTEAGLSYRRINMLQDVRRGRAVEWAKTPMAKLKAESWFDNVYEPFRAERKITSREASQLWRRTVDETWETLEEAIAGKEWYETYEELV